MSSRQEPVALLRGRLLEADVPEALPAMEVKKPVTVQILHTFEEALGVVSVPCRQVCGPRLAPETLLSLRSPNIGQNRG